MDHEDAQVCAEEVSAAATTPGDSASASTSLPADTTATAECTASGATGPLDADKAAALFSHYADDSSAMYAAPPNASTEPDHSEPPKTQNQSSTNPADQPQDDATSRDTPNEREAQKAIDQSQTDQQRCEDNNRATEESACTPEHPNGPQAPVNDGFLMPWLMNVLGGHPLVTTAAGVVHTVEAGSALADGDFGKTDQQLNLAVQGFISTITGGLAGMAGGKLVPKDSTGAKDVVQRTASSGAGNALQKVLPSQNYIPASNDEPHTTPTDCSPPAPTLPPPPPANQYVSVPEDNTCHQ